MSDVVSSGRRRAAAAAAFGPGFLPFVARGFVLVNSAAEANRFAGDMLCGVTRDTLLLLLLFVLIFDDVATDDDNAIGGRPKRTLGVASSQSRDRRGLPTLPFRTGAVAPVAFAAELLINFCQSCSHTKLPASM